MLVAKRKRANHPLTHPARPACHKCWGQSSEQGGSDTSYLDLLKQNHHEELSHEFAKDPHLQQQRNPERKNRGPGRFQDRAAAGLGPNQHLGPGQAPWDVWDLPPAVGVGPTGHSESFGPRHRPVNGTPDPGGWHPGMPYGQKAWEAYLEKLQHPNETESQRALRMEMMMRHGNETGPQNPEWWAKNRKAPSVKPTSPSSTLKPVQHQPIYNPLHKQPKTPTQKAPSSIPAPLAPTTPPPIYVPPKPIRQVHSPLPDSHPQLRPRLHTSGHYEEHPEDFPYEKLKPGENPFADRPKFPKRRIPRERLDVGQDIEPLYNIEGWDPSVRLSEEEKRRRAASRVKQ